MSCSGDGLQFKGVFMRYLGGLYAVSPTNDIQRFILRQARTNWDYNRNPDNQFGSRWSGPFDSADFTRQGAVLDSLNAAVAAGHPNLALGRPVESSAPCAPNESGSDALDGSALPNSKWCSGGASGQYLSVDLQEARTVVAFTIRHAGAGGEDSGWNTKDFKIEISDDGLEWEPVVTVSGNTDDISHHPIDPVDTHHVRLTIEQAQSAPTLVAARIYEFEVLGAGL
jgi:hypothetical protein